MDFIYDDQKILFYIDHPQQLIYDLWRDYFLLERGDNPDKWIDNWVKEFLDAFVTSGKHFFAITGANAVGKTAAIVQLLYYFFLTRYEALIPVTSVDQPHLRSVFWTESRRWYDRSSDIQTIAEHTLTYIKHRELPDTWFAVARTARKQGESSTGKHATGLQGFHSDHLLFLIDEGSGVDDVNWDSAESSIRKEDQFIVAISNPLRVYGRMFEVFHLDRYTPLWYTRAVSYKESSFIDQTMAEAQIKSLGENSPVAQIRYFGRFPKRGSVDAKPSFDDTMEAIKRTFLTDLMAVQCLIKAYVDNQPNLNCPYELVQLEELEEKLALQKKFTSPEFDPATLYSTSMGGKGALRDKWEQMRQQFFMPPCRLGVDLARFGDDEITFCVRRNWRILELDGFHGLKQPEILGRIKNYFYRFTDLEIAIIDATGIAGGLGIVDPLLEEDPDKYPCIELAFGSESTQPDKYVNLSTEMWMFLAENINKLLLPDDDIMLNQATTRKWRYTGKNAVQVAIESKESMKSRSLSSPDRFESIGLAYAPVEIYETEEAYEEEDEIIKPTQPGVFNLG